jgi:hypothetical protein
MSNKQPFPPCSVCGEPSGWSADIEGRKAWFCNNHWNGLKRRLRAEGVGVGETYANPPTQRRRSSAPAAPAQRGSSNSCLYQLLGAAAIVVVVMVLLLALTGGLK